MGQSAKISDHVVQEIDELICNPEELGPHAALFDLKVEQEHYGPIEGADLKEFFIIHDDLADQAQVKRTHEELYVPYFEHPHFQRRKPQLVSQQSLDDVEHEYLWVLKDGQKSGPYTKTQLSQQVESSQVMRTDLISLDEGNTWQRLFELEEFDRRKLAANQLPPTPQGQVFVNSLRETRTQLASSDNEREEAEALTGLAYIGNLKNGKGVEGEKRVPRPLGAQMEETEASFKKPIEKTESQWIWYALFGASLIGIVALMLTWQTSERDTPQEMPTARNTQNMKTQKAQEVEPQQQAPSNENTQAPMQPRRPSSQPRDASMQRNERQPLKNSNSRSRAARNTTSFRESQAYRQAQNRSAEQEREMQDETYEDGYYYDEGDVPPEQDPVRSQLSRETTDPRNSWADDLESINDNPEYYEEEYVEPGVYPEDELYEEY